MKIQDAHYTGFNFDWMVLRELRFADNMAEAPTGEALRDLEVNVQVQSRLDSTHGVCRTTIRVSLSPPSARPDQFQAISVLVEGQFSVPAGATPSVPLEAFAKRQAAAILMPFARDAIAGLTRGSRFGQVLLPPINVIALIEAIEKEEGGVLPAGAPAP